jgi:hypothetical protein
MRDKETVRIGYLKLKGNEVMRLEQMFGILQKVREQNIPIGNSSFSAINQRA